MAGNQTIPIKKVLVSGMTSDSERFQLYLILIFFVCYQTMHNNINLKSQRKSMIKSETKIL